MVATSPRQHVEDDVGSRQQRTLVLQLAGGGGDLRQLQVRDRGGKPQAALDQLRGLYATDFARV